MHLLVTNIPEDFRTPDLRNFFSDILEEGAFNCFHFRHRPHKHLIELLPKENPENPAEKGECQLDSSGVRSRCELCGQRQTPSPSGFPVGLRLSDEIPQNPKQTFEAGRPWRSSSTSSDVNLSKPGDGEIRSRPCECACQERKTVGLGLQNDKVQDESQIVDSNSSTQGSRHWLSSGLSGLSSLIKEKKQKAIKESLVEQDKTFIKPKPPTTATSSSMNVHKFSDKASSSGNKLMLDSAVGTCCMVDVKEDHVEKFHSLYHRKYWVDRNGDILPRQCLIINFNVDCIIDESSNDKEKDYMTRGESEVQRLKLMDVKNMIEFCPPPVMPQGNVGTPTLYFKDLIRSCKLPGAIITKLGLQFPRTRGKKRLSQVPFDYGTRVYSGNTDNRKKCVAFTAAGDLIPASVDFKRPSSRPKKEKKKLRKSGPRLELEKEAEDGAEVEEWERYETFHNDVTSQDRTKERVYEKEIELVWEKGGPGLVFYTDAQYWREQEGDFDEQTTDEWDVDMSVYYEKGAGDYDAHTSVDMLESNKLRSGALTQSAFMAEKKERIGGSREDMMLKKDTGKRKKRGPAAPPKIGDFEVHTRGFGRRLLESQGWTDGVGLGRQSNGLPYALDNDGQHPRDKKGFGYHGEKFEGWGESSASLSRRANQRSSADEDCDTGIRISTVFDTSRDVDPPVSHMRTSEPTRLSHRQKNVVFTKASPSDTL